MEAEQLSEALSELEQRVERLRALYEQYFMGIEKIEPSVSRKDVERRFWLLRREQIRNTAMRFKLNTINQRYNTYQQYWQRCVREIEAGTYRRHLIKAEKRFGAEALTIASRKRLNTRGSQAELDKQREAEEKAKQALAQMPDLDSFDVDVDLDISDIAGDELFAPAPPRQRSVPAKKAHALDELDDLEALMGLDAGPTIRSASASPPRPAAHPPPRRPSPPPRRKQQEGFGDIGGVFAEDDDDITAPQRGIPDPMRVAPSHRPSPPTRPRPAVPAPPPLRRPSRPEPPRPPAPAARPAAPAARVKPAAAAPKPAARDSAELPDDRVKAIYREYVSAKRSCAESTSSITEAGLAKSLRNSAEKLRKKHKGRRIDYEVVIKEGRAVLKPVVKS